MPIFVFTDIEESTRLWEQHREEMAEALQRHDQLLRKIIDDHSGRVIEHTGDGVYAVFEQGGALDAILEIQKQFHAEAWGELGPLRIRIGAHGCGPEREGIDYFSDGKYYHGPIVNQTARITAVGWGGQTLLTPAVLRLDTLPAGAETHDLGPHMLKSLVRPQRIYQLHHPDLPRQAFPPLRSLSVRPNNLPPQDTPFIGREEEVETVRRHMAGDDCRLLTITGPGGVGKTRLSLQAAAESIEHFSNGVFFVPLAPVSSTDYIVSTIADALNFAFYGGQNQKLQLLNYLQEKELLLVLDNFEHLLDGAGIVAEVMEAAPQVKVLVTCRQRLNFGGEQLLELWGMPLPQTPGRGAETYSAIQLFLQAARRANPDFTLTDENEDAVLQICRLVGGMPLGIELAAAWVRIFSCREIAGEIEENLTFLTSSRPDVPDRHRSLYAVCDYFWAHLAPVERSILRKLSVFRGGFTAEAAWQVAGASFFFLSALIDRAFLRKTPGRVNTRYNLHEVLRQYAAARLNKYPRERDQTQERHGHYYTTSLHHLTPRLQGEEQQAALETFRHSVENVRAAWQWTLANGRYDEAGQSLHALFLAHEMLDWYEEGAVLFKQAIAIAEKDPGYDGLLARLLIRLGRFSERTSQHERAETLLQRGLKLARTLNRPEETALALYHLGTNQSAIGKHTESTELLETSLAIFRETGNEWYTARVLSGLGNSAYRVGNYEAAREFFWESYILAERIGDQRNLATQLNTLALVLNKLGEHEAAEELMGESLRLQETLGNRWGQASAHNNLGVILFDKDQFISAKEHYEESLVLFKETNNQWTIAAVQDSLAVTLTKLGQHQEAKTHFREALQTAVSAQVAPIAVDILVGIAYLLAAEGNPERAIELLSFALQHPALDIADTEWRAQQLLDELEAELAPEMIARARAGITQKDLETITSELLPQLDD